MCQISGKKANEYYLQKNIQKYLKQSKILKFN